MAEDFSDNIININSIITEISSMTIKLNIIKKYLEERAEEFERLYSFSSSTSSKSSSSKSSYSKKSSTISSSNSKISKGSSKNSSTSSKSSSSKSSHSKNNTIRSSSNSKISKGSSKNSSNHSNSVSGPDFGFIIEKITKERINTLIKEYDSKIKNMNEEQREDFIVDLVSTNKISYNEGIFLSENYKK